MFFKISKKITAKYFTFRKINKGTGSINGKLLKPKSTTSVSQGYKFKLTGKSY